MSMSGMERQPSRAAPSTSRLLERAIISRSVEGRTLVKRKSSSPSRNLPRETRARIAWSTDGHREYSEQSINPKKKWTLFLTPHIHLDVGYSDYQAKVAAIHSHVIDEALEMTARHPDFRFSLDGSWPLDQFMKTRTAAQQQRAIAAIRDQQLFVPADYANLLTGFPAAETLIRSLYASANFSRKHGTPFNYATITDVPSYSWSYASVLSSAGISCIARRQQQLSRARAIAREA